MDIGTPLIEVHLTEDEAVDGCRMWFLIPVEGRRLLAPVALDMHRPWNPDGPTIAGCVVPEAERLPTHQDAPALGCRCGLYAMTELNAVVAGGAMDREQRLRVAVLGRVRLWGRVMAGPNGWRAGFARVTELLALPGQEQTVRVAASVYGVPVRILAEPVGFEGGPLDGTIRFGTPSVDSFIATFHDHSFVPNHDWEAGTEGGLVDEGLKDVTYRLEDGGFVCVSVRPSPGAGCIVDDQGWAEVIDEVIRATSWEPGRSCVPLGSSPVEDSAATTPVTPCSGWRRLALFCGAAG